MDKANNKKTFPTSSADLIVYMHKNVDTQSDLSKTLVNLKLKRNLLCFI